jgi:hypothetical protein
MERFWLRLLQIQKIAVAAVLAVIYFMTVFSDHLKEADVHLWQVIIELTIIGSLLFIFMANGYYLLLAMYRA